MKPEVKAKWLAALTGGKYFQAREELEKITDRRVTNCCLGVLCDLYIKDTGNDIREINLRDYGGDVYKSVAFAQHIGQLPDCVALWAGLEDTDPKVMGVNSKGKPVEAPLSVFNDGCANGDWTAADGTSYAVKRKTFKQIAEYIKASL